MLNIKHDTCNCPNLIHIRFPIGVCHLNFNVFAFVLDIRFAPLVAEPYVVNNHCVGR